MHEDAQGGSQAGEPLLNGKGLPLVPTPDPAFPAHASISPQYGLITRRVVNGVGARSFAIEFLPKFLVISDHERGIFNQ